MVIVLHCFRWEVLSFLLSNYDLMDDLARLLLALAGNQWMWTGKIVVKAQNIIRINEEEFY